MTAYQLGRISPRSEPNLLLIRNQADAGIEAERGTVTMSPCLKIGKLTEEKRTQQPFYRNFLQPTSIASDKLVFGGTGGGLSGWDSYVPGLFQGGKIRVYRITSDTMTKVAERMVAGVSMDVRRYFHTINGAPAVLPASVQNVLWSPPNYWGVNGATEFYFRIKAVSADGKGSAWSNVVTYKPGKRTGAERNVSTSLFVAGTKADSRDYTTDAGLPTPTLVATTGADQALTLSWNPQSGLSYLIEWTHDLSWSAENWIKLDGGVADLRADDMFIFERKLPFTFKSEIFSPRLQGVNQGGFINRGPCFKDDLPPGATLEYMEEGGREFARITLPAGQSLYLEVYPNGGAKQTWYSVLEKGKTYVARITARMDRAQTVKVKMRGMEAGRDTVLPCTIGTTFADYDTEFVQTIDAPDDATPRGSNFTITGPCVFDLENFTHFDKSMGGPYETNPADVEMVAAAKPLYIRQHGSIKSRPMSWSVKSYLKTQGRGGTGLPLWLKQTRMVGEKAGAPANPWLQIPGFFDESEIYGVAEYFCTPYDPAVDTQTTKPFAYMRHAQGQTQPWQDVFNAIRVECDNENWNPIAGFFFPPGASGFSNGHINGKLLDRIAEIILSHPDCKPAKWNFYLGLWGGQGWGAGSFNGDSVRASKHADFAGFANYNGGWDSGLTAARRADVPLHVFAAIADSAISDRGRLNREESARTLVAQLAENTVGRVKPIRAAHYESGPGYNLNGLNGATVTAEDSAQQEALMKSVGVGTATLDAYLCNAAEGVVSNNFFTIGRGECWNAAAKFDRGGAANPPFLWFGFINRHLNGKVERLDLTASEPLRDRFAQSKMRTDLGGMLRAYRVIRADGTQAFALCNISDVQPLEVTILKKRGGEWTRHWMPGPHTLTNFTAATRNAVELKSEAAPAWSEGSITLTIPPGLAEVYVEAPAAGAAAAA